MTSLSGNFVGASITVNLAAPAKVHKHIVSNIRIRQTPLKDLAIIARYLLVGVLPQSLVSI